VQTQGIVDTIQTPLQVLDGDFRIAGGNTAFFETFRLDHEDAMGRSLFEIGNGQWEIPELRQLLERRRAAATKDILLEETRHRMRNLLAVVRSLATRRARKTAAARNTRRGQSRQAADARCAGERRAADAGASVIAGTESVSADCDRSRRCSGSISLRRGTLSGFGCFSFTP